MELREVAMTLGWLVYISRSMIDPRDLEAEIAGIIATSCHRNIARGITGALIASEAHLAQYMEGPAAAIADLVARIGRDPRQTDLHVVEGGARADRRFPDWAMAYAGQSVFIRRLLSGMFEDARRGRRPRGEELITLMRTFSVAPG